MFCMAVDGSTSHRNEGGLEPLTILDIGTRARQSYVGVHFNVVPHFVGRRYGTKFFFL
jgi:hypothetical protein